jgi:thymidylate kinase
MLHLKVTLPFLLPVPLCKRLHYQKILQSEEFGGVFSRLRVMAKVLAEVFFRHLLHIEIQRPALIAFSGMDGSGKTSYATTVKKVCDRCGLRTCYIWSRVGSVTGFQSLTKLISHQGVHPTSSLISPCDVYHKMQGYFAHPEIASIWRAVNIMDLCLFYNLQLRWALWRRRIVICDRYLPDIFTDLFIFTPGRGNPMVWTFLAWCLPKATMNFFLDVPPDTALQRSRNKECLEYLERQSVLYREVQDFANVRRIDVGKELTATCNPLIQELLKGYFEHYETLYLY